MGKEIIDIASFQFFCISETCKFRVENGVDYCGEGGSTYGDKLLTTLHLGSGGGSGGNDDALHDNPIGGRYVSCNQGIERQHFYDNSRGEKGNQKNNRFAKKLKPTDRWKMQ